MKAQKPTISWQAPEFPHHAKTRKWYAIFAVLVALLVIYGLVSNDWTFSLAVLIFAGTYILFERHTPKMVDIEISPKFVKIGRHRFSYRDLKCFWIAYDPPLLKKLYLRSASRLKPDIFVSLGNADPEDVRQAMQPHLEEAKGLHEPFSDSLARLFKL